MYLEITQKIIRGIEILNAHKIWKRALTDILSALDNLAIAAELASQQFWFVAQSS